mgnify:CR=1 FL=1
MGDDEIIQGHRESQEETGEDSGHQVRKGGFVKSVKWGGSKIQGGLISADVRLPQLWQNTQDYIGNVKGNMCNQDCLKSKGKSNMR